MTQHTNTNPHTSRPRQSPVREEVTMVIGGQRAHRPIIAGRVFFMAVQVTLRANTLEALYEYLPGFAVGDSSRLAASSELGREQLEFVPRIAVDHADLAAYIDLYTEGHKQVSDLLMKKNRAMNRL